MSTKQLADNQKSWVGVGRRKTSVAKVTLVSGDGTLQVNKKPGDLYFQFNSQYLMSLKAPLYDLGLESSYDICIETNGGGLRGQVEAARLGISRALCLISELNRPSLKATGYLTRDSRSKERKKYGLRKARKAPQYSKR